MLDTKTTSIGCFEQRIIAVFANVSIDSTHCNQMTHYSDWFFFFPYCWSHSVRHLMHTILANVPAERRMFFRYQNQQRHTTEYGKINIFTIGDILSNTKLLASSPDFPTSRTLAFPIPFPLSSRLVCTFVRTSHTRIFFGWWKKKEIACKLKRIINYVISVRRSKSPNAIRVHAKRHFQIWMHEMCDSISIRNIRTKKRNTKKNGKWHSRVCVCVRGLNGGAWPFFYLEKANS